MGVMSSPRFLSLYLLGAFLLLLLLLLPDSEAQYYGDVTSSPDYDSDYNATFDYSFFSNASSEDLERLTERFLNLDETEEAIGEQEEEEEVTATMTTTRRTMEKGGVKVPNAAAFPLCLEIGTLLWTLVILLVLNSQQLQYTL